MFHHLRRLFIFEAGLNFNDEVVSDADSFAWLDNHQKLEIFVSQRHSHRCQSALTLLGPNLVVFIDTS